MSYSIPSLLIATISCRLVDVMDEEDKSGPVALVPQLRVFGDVAGYCGVCVCLSVCPCVHVSVCVPTHVCYSHYI